MSNEEDFWETFKKEEDPMYPEFELNSNIRGKLADVFEMVSDVFVDDNDRKRFKETAFIAGGSIVSLTLKEPVNDYDFFFNSKEDMDHFKNVIADQILLSQLITNSISKIDIGKNAITLTHRTLGNIQLITRIYGPPSEVCGKFDYYHSMNHYYTKDFKVILYGMSVGTTPALKRYVSVGQPNLYMMDPSAIHCKELRFNPNCENKFGALQRMQKFVKRGWTMEPANTIKLFLAINQVDMEEYSEKIGALY